MTFGADALHDVFVVVGKEAVGEGDDGDGLVFETIGLAASGAGEVDVVEMVAAFATADTILFKSRPVVDFVQQVVLGEKAKGTENAGTVHLGQPCFHICQRKGFRTVLNGSVNEESDGSGANAVLLEDFFCVHLSKC